jgi:hypothetical protein
LAHTRNGYARAGFVRGTYPTLDLIALRSDQIGTIVIISSEDSMKTPTAIMGVQKVGYRVIRNIRGQLPKPPLSFSIYKVGPGIQVGDTLLWLRQMTLDETNAQVDTAHADHLFDLSDMRRTSFWEYALTRDFRVLRDSNALLTTVLNRMAMVETGKPLGDDRQFSVDEFARGRGAITDEMLPGSEADLATWDTHCCGLLSYPADKDLLPGLFEQTRDPDPWTRAFAAEALAQYPGEKTRRRLSDLLSETGARLDASGYQGADSVRGLLAVQAAAIESMKRLKEEGQVRSH